MRAFFGGLILAFATSVAGGAAHAGTGGDDAQLSPLRDPAKTRSLYADHCTGAGFAQAGRLVCADVAALDQTLVYNRFGSFNPFGMIFALNRDLDDLFNLQDSASAKGPGQDPICEDDIGTKTNPDAKLRAGEVRLRDCKRPRPLVLRAAVGDYLLVRVENLLMARAPDFSSDLCGDQNPKTPAKRSETGDVGREAVQADLSRDTNLRVAHGEATCSDGRGASASAFDTPDLNWPRTRDVNFVVEGLETLPIGDHDIDRACLGTDAVRPGESFLCLYRVAQEGTHFLGSRAAPAGGQGDGGSITHGLFGAVMAERPGTRWYRSQVSAAALDKAWAPKDVNAGAVRHARSGALDYEVAVDGAGNAAANGVPVLAIARSLDRSQAEIAQANRLEIVHSDLNAIIFCDTGMAAANVKDDGPLGCAVSTQDALATKGTTPSATDEPDVLAFREFTVFFHDELKTFYTRNFEELAKFGQLAGVRDGFAINYGASGMGTVLLANRKGIGPAASCIECLYEEFFLTSWANGDPALLEWYDDDPSNVHHSYMNDPVVFRNFHAGPKETHVFHLHAHQWFAGNDPGRGSYLDSQTVAPGQGFTYNIYHGGRPENLAMKWSTGGSGNRNRTVGDSIFHCHLYPHFAQGMWALWRVHDVFEDGSRMLPDGAAKPGLSTTIRTTADKQIKRPGSVDPKDGSWIDKIGDTEAEKSDLGTPIPALVPLPGEALPPLPVYGAPEKKADNAVDVPERKTEHAVAPHRKMAAAALARLKPVTPERLIRIQAVSEPETLPEQGLVSMPGYPFYIAGRAGHRPPQAPNDIARVTDLRDEDKSKYPGLETGDLLSGGLGRHVIVGGELEPPELPEAASKRVKDLVRKYDADQLADPPKAPDPTITRALERMRAQIVAKAVAMGDMTAHFKTAKILTLPPGGTRLERNAMAFHYDGAGLTLFDTAGTALPKQTSGGRYMTPAAPVPGGPAQPRDGYHVNGAPPVPGAPFADPCGVGTPTKPDQAAIPDPFLAGITALTGDKAQFIPDPDLQGFRRYEGSAVQLDMVVNQAGWHDPQARINVLSAVSDTYKDRYTQADGRVVENPGLISPRISDTEEPFFFRALSGECIEFRHTNELPKELQLDDFQVKTPTDTIGQHIHLVKFDVTASDGSANGWNYEDGTFAPDELMARRCAAKAAGAEGFQVSGGGSLSDLGTHVPTDDDCKMKDIWRKTLSENRGLFQTTVQRWFADPISTLDGTGSIVDRTMRTVFSHDHFGPSSIQQHGFYTALLIEPGTENGTKICSPDAQGGAECDLLKRDLTKVRTADDKLVGTSKLVVLDGAKAGYASRDYREFALAVADFALLYDPRDRSRPDSLNNQDEDRAGMALLACEARHAGDPRKLNDVCRSNLQRASGKYYAAADDVPPAWIAAGLAGDYGAHMRDYSGTFGTALNLFNNAPDDPESDAGKLREHLETYRKNAAFPTLTAQESATGNTLARPVNPPRRPEAISVDHHDPYLVNYRMAAVPLRIGTKNQDGSRSDDCAPYLMGKAGKPGIADSAVLSHLKTGALPECSYTYQIAGLKGDAGFVFSSYDGDFQHGSDDTETPQPTRDPETPILEAYQDERIVFRLIQGAQEVQHVFNIMGMPAPRNIDQRYSQGMRPLAAIGKATRKQCFDRVRKTQPQDYDKWLYGYKADDTDWVAYAKALAECDNVEGYTFAQEIGISEHFEIKARLRQDIYAIQLAPQQPVRTGSSTISDYFYNFGTLDSLWNGAWGLTRIYLNKNAQFKGEDRIGHRLMPLAEIDAASATTSALSTNESPVPVAPAEKIAPPTCPVPGPGRLSVRETKGVIVALRVDDLTVGKGTDYGLGQTDPDGLMLALLAPDRIKIESGSGTAPAYVDRDAVIAAVRQAYTPPGASAPQPEPFVMRVNAGDCVVLRYINTLQDPQKDALGDALMPRITRLNTDPVPEISDDTPGRSPRGALTPTTLPKTGLRPSAWVGLSIGLSGGDLIRNLPLGFGINASPLAPAVDNRATISDEFRFYAGRVVMRDTSDVTQKPGPQPAESTDPLAACAGNAVGPARAVECAAKTIRTMMQTGAPYFDVVPPNKDLSFNVSKAKPNVDKEDRSTFTYAGKEWRVTVKGIPIVRADDPGTYRLDLSQSSAPSVMSCAQQGACTAQATDLMRDFGQGLEYFAAAQVHFIPYAFGPVPVRASADPFSQTPHGLFGTIDVVPQDWDLGLPESRSLAMPSENLRSAMLKLLGRPATQSSDEEWEWQTRVASLAQGFGQPNVYDIPKKEEGPEQHRLREFVLFYQDGLNLHDARSKIAWTMGGVSVPAHIVPDCTVCDDSYDWGEQGVSYRSPGYIPTLRALGVKAVGGASPERAGQYAGDMNGMKFPPDFFSRKTDDDRFPLTLHACLGEQVVIRAIHPGGRARQRAFVMNGLGYDDLFPGFGFPNSALLAPGKAVSAWLMPRNPETGGKAVSYLWGDGPTTTAGGGTWGLITLHPAGTTLPGTKGETCAPL